MNDINDMVFTLKDMCKYLQIGRVKALQLLGTGEIKGKKVGRDWRVLKSEVDKYLKDHN